MKKRALALAAFSIVIAILLASCGVGPQCKLSSCASPGLGTQSNLQDGVYIKNGASNLSAGTYSVPVVYDWDGDGKKDLLIGYNEPGDSYGYIRFYKNLGTDSSPVFNGYTLIQACNNTCNLRVAGTPGF